MARIVYSEEIARDIFRLELEAAEWVNLEVLPGQFCHIKAPDAAHILRRPISVMGFDAAYGRLRLAIQVKGAGTRAIVAAPVGSELDVLLPLGNHFALEGAKSLLLVGGGVGVAPMEYCAEYYEGKADIRRIYGYRGRDFVYGRCEGASVCTDDGSFGEKGLVTLPLEREIAANKPDAIWACGPLPMLHAVRDIALRENIPCKVSLEERMGCGIGACLCCSVKVGDENAWHHKCVCSDGPVFDAKEVLFHG